MANEWILDVISDLKAFAERNGLPGLADQLETAADVAWVDLAMQDSHPVKGTHRHAGTLGGVYRTSPDG
jgi:hypothetical protein